MDLNEISMLSQKMVELEGEIERQESKLSETKETLRNLKEETLPCALQELGLESVTLSTGEKLTVAQEVYCSIPVAFREQAYAWLESNGFGGIIKTSVEASFGKGELDAAAAALDALRSLGIEASMSRGVHAQTLKAFAKESLANGVDIPMDVFGIRPTWTTKLKAARKS